MTQHWKNFCKWWDDLSESFAPDYEAFPKRIFPERNRVSVFSKPCEVVMFQITHLQRACILKHFVKDLRAFKGITIMDYLDGIQRKLHMVEREDNSLYVRYGNWAWSQKDSPYIIVKEAIADIVHMENVKVMREAVAMVGIVFSGLRGNEEVHGIMVNCLSFIMNCDSVSFPLIFEMVKKFSCELCNT